MPPREGTHRHHHHHIGTCHTNDKAQKHSWWVAALLDNFGCSPYADIWNGQHHAHRKLPFPCIFQCTHHHTQTHSASPSPIISNTKRTSQPQLKHQQGACTEQHKHNQKHALPAALSVIKPNCGQALALHTYITVHTTGSSRALYMHACNQLIYISLYM